MTADTTTEDQIAQCRAAHDRLVDAVATKYWTLPAKDRGDFVVGVVNDYLRELAIRRPDLPPKARDELTVKFGTALVRKIDYQSGDPRLRRLLAVCEPAGKA